MTDFSSGLDASADPASWPLVSVWAGAWEFRIPDSSFRICLRCELLTGFIATRPLRLASGRSYMARIYGSKKNWCFTESGLELVEPGRLRIEMREENPIDPLGSLAWTILRTKYRSPSMVVTPSTSTLPGVADIEGPRTVRASPETSERRCVKIRKRTGQRHLEVMLRTGVPFHEHVVGNRPEGHLTAPHLGPHLGIVVDVANNGRLGADHRPVPRIRRMAFATACRARAPSDG